MSALYFYQKWMKDGNRVHDNSYPDIGKSTSISIKKVFLASIDVKHVKRSKFLNCD